MLYIFFLLDAIIQLFTSVPSHARRQIVIPLSDWCCPIDAISGTIPDSTKL